MAPENVYPAFCIHFDHHPHPEHTPQYGAGVTMQSARAYLREVRPDAVQLHAIGTHGYAAFPSRIATVASSVVGDPLQTWKDACEAEGVRFGIYCSPYGGGRLSGKYKVETRAGMKLDTFVCPNKPYLDEFLLPFLLEVIERYDPDQFWMDGTQTPWNFRDECVCEYCQKAYRGAFGSELPLQPEGEEWMAVDTFSCWTNNRVIERIGRTIHTASPKATVCFNFVGLYPDSRNAPAEADWLSADCLNEGDLHRAPLQATFLASHRRTSDIMLYESVCIKTDAAVISAKRSLAQLKTEAAIILAHGHRLNLWQNPQPDGSLAPAKASYAAELGRFVRERQQWTIDSRSAADVAVFFPQHCRAAELDRRNKAGTTACQLLQEAHIPFDYLFEYNLEELLSSYRLVIIPEVGTTTPEAADALADFVRSGGTLLAAACPELDADKGWLSAVLGEKIAARQAAVDAGYLYREGDMLRLGRPRYSLTGTWECRKPYHPVPGHYLLKVNEAKVEHTPVAVPREDTPWLAERKIGKGRIWLMTSEIFSDFGERNFPSVRDLVASVITDALDREPQLVLRGHPGIHTVLNRRGNNLYLHLVNMTPGLCCNRRSSVYFDSVPVYRDIDVAVRVPQAPQVAELLPDEKELPFEQDGKTVCLTIPELRHHTAVRFENVFCA